MFEGHNYIMCSNLWIGHNCNTRSKVQTPGTYQSQTYQKERVINLPIGRTLNSVDGKQHEISLPVCLWLDCRQQTTPAVTPGAYSHPVWLAGGTTATGLSEKQDRLDRGIHWQA